MDKISESEFYRIKEESEKLNALIEQIATELHNAMQPRDSKYPKERFRWTVREKMFVERDENNKRVTTYHPHIYVNFRICDFLNFVDFPVEWLWSDWKTETVKIRTEVEQKRREEETEKIKKQMARERAEYERLKKKFERDEHTTNEMTKEEIEEFLEIEKEQSAIVDSFSRD